MKKLFFLLSCLCSGFIAFAQPASYSMKNAHAHNDYLHALPFYEAYALGYGMIEADVFLQGNDLVVAHEKYSIKPERTLSRLYIEPLINQINLNEGKPYKNGQRLQLLIDIKEDGLNALKKLEEILKPYRKYFDLQNNPDAVQIIISGDMPKYSEFNQFDSIFFFDGRPGQNYSPESFRRVALISTSISTFTRWNGKGLITAPQYSKIKAFVDSVHTIGKEIRFWGVPNSRTAYMAMIKFGVDYIGTDQLSDLASLFKTLENYTGKPIQQHIPYLPDYHTDGIAKKSKNVIFLIGDGMGLAQIYSGITANGGKLNWTSFKNIGFSKTNSADSFCTDSAAGATAFSTGEKTNNRYIGMNTRQEAIENISEILGKKQIKTGLVVSEEITGATPACFYAHEPERDWYQLIADDLPKSPVSLTIGAGKEAFKPETLAQLAKKGSVLNSLDELKKANPLANNYVFVPKEEVRPKHEGRGSYLSDAFDAAINQLGKSPNGFFLMLEGSKIDWGGHANNLNYVVNEMLDFDRVIGKALEFADKNGETTVIVTADHETGGLSLLEGDFKTGKVEGNFSTNDHSGIPVPVIAYGPNADIFRGFYENNTIFEKLLKCFRISQTRK
ncbi:alkaline phosphatase [Pseudarcicella hirudinis]|uniref:Alkaline phosphatase n=1 Tax=Pseudarcicella hirudinis TaxID=1079859 RepID=A0A1I5X378_9BACT|nr:alkaline phosphatase [Pseudarcicella hirudinis]SFQ26398.1 alkaline phosphatase [Pseudarcicella hirudinis]